MDSFAFTILQYNFVKQFCQSCKYTACTSLSKSIWIQQYNNNDLNHMLHLYFNILLWEFIRLSFRIYLKTVSVLISSRSGHYFLNTNTSLLLTKHINKVGWKRKEKAEVL
jgi:hypothetical protein